MKGHDDRVSSLAAGRKGKLLVSGSSDKTVGIWNLETKEKRFFTEHKGEVTSVAISPDEQFVASASLDQTIKIWDIRTRGVIQNIPVKSGVANAVAFSPDGKLLASGGVDKLVSIWDVQTGNLVQTFPPGHTRIISSVSFSPDGKQVASSSYDKTIRIWNVSDGKEIRPLTGHAGTVHSASYSTDGQFLSTASEDGTIIIWKSDTGDRLATLISIKDSNDWLVVTPEGFFDGSPSAREKLSWRFEKNTFNVRPIEVFFNEFYLPGVLATILGNGKLPSNSNISNRDRRQPEVNLKLVTNGSDPVVTAGRVTARIYVSQAVAGAKDIRLFRNGALVKVWHDDQLLTGQTSAMVETNIPVVAGLNHLTAYAFNKDDVKSKNSSVDVTGPASLARKGVSYIFAVGINEYANPVFDLDYAVPDAEDFAGEFDRQQTKLGNYDHTEVKILKNKDATKKNILDALAELSAKIKPEDALIIYFAGHGAAKGKRFYLIPHDLGYDGDKPRSDSVEFRTILSHSISDEDLETAVEGIDAGHLLMIIDACNSGQALESDEKRQGPMNTKGLAQRADEKGMYILAAAQGDQKALETTKLGHGLLTFALVDEGLKTDKADLEPKDGKVLMREWLDYATNRVPLLEQDQSKARQLERETMKETKPGKGVDFQRPKVFYPGGTDSNQLVVARPKPLN